MFKRKRRDGKKPSPKKKKKKKKIKQKPIFQRKMNPNFMKNQKNQEEVFVQVLSKSPPSKKEIEMREKMKQAQIDRLEK